MIKLANIQTKKYKVILASASIGRLKTLRASGINPYVLSPNLDENKIIQNIQNKNNRNLSAKQTVKMLAQAKGETAIKLFKQKNLDKKFPQTCVLISGDSLFSFEGLIFGKPPNYKTAKKRLKLMSGKTGKLFSAIWICNLKSNKKTNFVDSTDVTIGKLNNVTIDNYLATGEPYSVAGGFTIDGFGGPFIKSIKGDPHTVIGMPLFTLRLALNKLNIDWFELLDKSLYPTFYRVP